jgi:hypothetical protein
MVISLGTIEKRCTRLSAASDKVYQLFSHGRWFSPDTPASSTTKTGRHDIAEILLKVTFNKYQNKRLIQFHFFQDQHIAYILINYKINIICLLFLKNVTLFTRRFDLVCLTSPSAIRTYVRLNN